MAIVKMKRLTVVGAEEERERCVKKLQALGVLHIVPFKEDIPEPADLNSALLSIDRVIDKLESRAKKLDESPFTLEGDVDELENRAAKAISKISDLESNLISLEKDRYMALPWGGNNAQSIQELAEHGVFIKLYLPRPKNLDELDVSDAAWSETFQHPGRAGQPVLAVLSDGEPVEVDCDELPPPERTAESIEGEMGGLEAELKIVEGELDELCGALPKLQSKKAELEDKISFQRAFSSVRAESGLFALSGWCPAEDGDEVKDDMDGFAAVLLEEPKLDDDVPVELINGPVATWFEPLIKMFELPHYHGIDSTVLMAPFMTIFFALSLGDAAYGLILFLAAMGVKKKFKPEGVGLLVANMLALFGGVTFGLGLLTGTFMGAPIYEFSFIKGLGLHDQSLLFILSSSPENFFYLSLVLGVIQMTFGMGIKINRLFQQKRYQESLSTLGLMLLVPSIAVWLIYDPFIGQTGFIASLALVFLFNKPYDGAVKRIGGGAWGIYDRVIGLGGDIMSYVRIFGLGLASGIIGLVVNQMAGVVAGTAPVVGYIFAAMVFIFGHTFNLLMAIIGAVVHPARLQFLEFYGTFFEGGGSPYQPLKVNSELRADSRIRSQDRGR